MGTHSFSDSSPRYVENYSHELETRPSIFPLLFLEGTPHPQMFSKSFKAHLHNSLGSLLSMSIRLPTWIRTTKSGLCSSKVPWAPSKSTVKCGGDVNAVERLLWPQFKVESPFKSFNRLSVDISMDQILAVWLSQGLPGPTWQALGYLRISLWICTILYVVMWSKSVMGPVQSFFVGHSSGSLGNHV